jgi:hypothetical protein
MGYEMLSSTTARQKKKVSLAITCLFGLAPAIPDAVLGQVPQTQDALEFGPPGAKCSALRYADFRGTEDAPAQMTLARVVKGAGSVPDFCEVEGYVWRNVRFRIQFPLRDWNGKMVLRGNGGQGGYLPGDNPVAARPHVFPAPLERHYAVIAHDSGHFSTIADTLWGRNNSEGLIDYGFRAAHVTSLVGKAVLNRFYERPTEASYYLGCSNSGREALKMAESFPTDFDRIVAGSPSLAVSNLTLNFEWIEEHLQDQSRSGFDAIAADTLHKGVLAQCDAQDGTVDGVINEPRKCKIDFKPLLCKAGPANDCLTEHQIQIAREIYEGARRPDGSQIATSSAFPGSELTWVPFATPDWVRNYPADILQNLLLDPPAPLDWKPDPTRLGEYANRSGVGDILAGAQNPDIRKFKEHGGKLLMYYGWSDAFGGAREAMDYYETVERVMGGRKNTEGFFRLYMVPGMNHCGGGTGASEFDFLQVVDDWVSPDKAPDALKGYHPGPDGSPQFWRTIAPYRSSPTQ